MFLLKNRVILKFERKVKVNIIAMLFHALLNIKETKQYNNRLLIYVIIPLASIQIILSLKKKELIKLDGAVKIT